MPIRIDPDAYYSPAEAEPILHKKPNTQAKDRCLVNGPVYVKLGKAILYRGRDLLDHVQDRRVRHGAEYRDRFVRGHDPEDLSQT